MNAIRVATSGRFATANDYAPNAQTGKMLSAVLVNGVYQLAWVDVPEQPPTLSRTTPLVVDGAGAGGFITMTTEAGAPFVVDLTHMTNQQKLEIGVDASTQNFVSGTIGELRGNLTYVNTDGVVTLLNSSTPFTSADLRLQIIGTTVALQLNQSAAAGDEKTFVGSIWFKVVQVGQ